ncbi:MAG: AAA family ATPase [Pseudomonadota bacterium]
METISRFFGPPKGSFFLFGPRGTGKSTYLRRQFPQALFLDLLDPEQVRHLVAAPERLREIVAAHPEAPQIVIDEIQKVPELLSVVHTLIEERKERPFILTGSSARKLKRSGIDLLAGRALLKTLHPFMASELGSRMDLGRALRDGMLPVVWDSNEPEETLRSYAALYIREEVQAEGLVRRVGDFARFLEASALSHACALNVSNIARECGVERKTVEGYVSILEDLLLAWRLPVFAKKAARRMTAHPKFYFFDAGVFRSLRPRGPLDRAEEMSGQALEGLVAEHLRAWIAYTGGDWVLSYWRTATGLEVDFVLYGENGFYAFEVKRSRSIQPADLRGLKAFRGEYPACQPVLLYGGRDRLVRDGILCAPVEEFLVNLKPGRDPV